MLHIINQQDAFITYESLTNKVVHGVGNKTAHAIGKGTIELISYVNEQKCIICLEDVLYIPTTKNNLLSLSRWDNITQGEITIKNCILTLSTDNNIAATKEKAIHNYLYYINIAMHNPAFQPSKNKSTILKNFATNKPTKS